MMLSELQAPSMSGAKVNLWYLLPFPFPDQALDLNKPEFKVLYSRVEEYPRGQIRH